MGARLKRWSDYWVRIWSAVRELSGDDAYERYCAHQDMHHATQRILTRKEFFDQQQEKKWTGIKRCC